MIFFFFSYLTYFFYFFCPPFLFVLHTTHHILHVLSRVALFRSQIFSKQRSRPKITPVKFVHARSPKMNCQNVKDVIPKRPGAKCRWLVLNPDSPEWIRPKRSHQPPRQRFFWRVWSAHPLLLLAASNPTGLPNSSHPFLATTQLPTRTTRFGTLLETTLD
jgi:hypothetical protein